MSDMRNFLEAHADDILEDIGRFVCQETPSNDKTRLDDFAAFLADFAGEMSGGETETVPAETSGNHVVLHVPGSGEGAPVMLVGHFDTVWPAGTLETMPFSVADSIARGPGIFDMKTGLVQGLWALRALRETHVAHPPVVFMFNSDEEIGSPESRDMIAAQARESRAALVLEPSFDGALKTERKGVGRYMLRVNGRASHAGLDPAAGISAIDEMARLTLALHGETDFDTGTTVNVGVVRGGTCFNVVAAEAVAEVDLRIATIAEADRMDVLIKALKPHHPEAALHVEGGITWPPMKRNEAIGGLFDTAVRVGRQACALELAEASVGGASDGNTCAAAGIPVLDGLGAVGGGAHAAHEHIDIRHIPERAALLAHLIAAL